MNDTCTCGHGAGTTHQGGTGACIGYQPAKVTAKRADRKFKRCPCRQFKATS